MQTTWRNQKDNECKIVTPFSLCFCGHKYKDHALENTIQKNYHCKERSCLCPQYSYIPVQHDPVTRKCLIAKCTCKNKFTSRFNCKACGEEYGNHRTFFLKTERAEDNQISTPINRRSSNNILNPQDTQRRGSFDATREQAHIDKSDSEHTHNDNLRLLRQKMSPDKIGQGGLQIEKLNKQVPPDSSQSSRSFREESLANKIEQRNIYHFKDELGYCALKLFQTPHAFGARPTNQAFVNALNSIDPSQFLNLPYNSGIQRIENYDFKTPQRTDRNQNLFGTLQPNMRKSLQNVYEFSNLNLEGSLNLSQHLDYGKIGLRQRGLSYNNNPIPDHINYGFQH
ncbi:UNKNOWN [Stylonychia lemnae]|uniref:Protein FAM221A n=1 Tax=Stylonychia lemnae TaxID=5949 RepID=A0A078AHE6_STYLE|nr:UNKNOWN [Stylonychia lemnae]|eukprot:CDW81266.1 UNKNOWN [Stylonychia lemnae]